VPKGGISRVNKLITVRPSEWKDKLIEMMDGIESSMSGIDCIGVVAIPKDISNDEIITAYYNVNLDDMILIKEHMAMDVIDNYMKENIEKYRTDDIVFEKNDENGEDDENEIEGGEYQDEDVKKG
jgi:hypothetical protein